MSFKQPAKANLAQTACDQCHRCKLRCTRELPHCQRCHKIGSACTFSTGKPIGKPRGSKNRNSTRKVRVSEIDGNQRHETQSVSSPGAADEAWKDYQPLYHQRPSTITKDCAPSVGLSTNIDPNSNGSVQIRQDPDVGRYHAKNDISPTITSSEDSSIRHEPDAMISWPSAADNERHETLSLADPMDMQDSSHAIELQSPYISQTSSCGTVETLDQLIIRETVSSATACLCDPTCLRVVESFRQAQSRPTDASLDRSLLLLRSGVTVCERSLTCSSCTQASSTLASLLLIQGAMRCYSALLAAATGYSSNAQDLSGVTIGDFEVDDVLHGHVVIAVVKAEMRRGINVLVALEKGTQVSQSNSRVLLAMNHLSRALREEFSL